MSIDIVSGNIQNEMKSAGYLPGKPGVKTGKADRAYGVGRDPRLEGNADGKAIITEAIERLKSAGDLFNRRIDLRVDEETNRVVVKVIDTKTDKVIKEIPPEQVLRLAAKIQEMIGLLVDEAR